MSEKDKYLKLISKRGDRYGGCGGVHDLLIWCNKNNTQSVTDEEARLFYEMECEAGAEMELKS